VPGGEQRGPAAQTVFRQTLLALCLLLLCEPGLRDALLRTR
jgi:hypothetical protein